MSRQSWYYNTHQIFIFQKCSAFLRCSAPSPTSICQQRSPIVILPHTTISAPSFGSHSTILFNCIKFHPTTTWTHIGESWFSFLLTKPHQCTWGLCHECLPTGFPALKPSTLIHWHNNNELSYIIFGMLKTLINISLSIKRNEELIVFF